MFLGWWSLPMAAEEFTDREPQPEDGPDYHADHAAWEEHQHRGQSADPPGSCMLTCACGERYDSTNKTARKDHYFHGKKETHES
jgi:hypothetical protein